VEVVKKCRASCNIRMRSTYVLVHKLCQILMGIRQHGHPHIQVGISANDKLYSMVALALAKNAVCSAWRANTELCSLA